LVTTGKGAYFDKFKSQKGEITTIGKAIRALGSVGGGAIAPFAGMAPGAGASAGNNLAAAFSKWLGFGAYKVRVNSITNPESFIPTMHRVGQSVVVRHKEFVCDVLSGPSGTPTDFNVLRTLYLNPGLSTSFPWLASLARQYQEYTWRGMVFHFVSTSGNSVASTNTALGTVMMHTDYRVTNTSPASKVELLNEYFATDNKPSECFVHPIECDPKENPYNVQYVRTGAVPSGEDAKTYDLAKVNIATQGMPSTSMNCGEIWVTYEVELRKPQITSMLGDADHLYGSTSVSTTAPLGTSVSTASGNTIGCTTSGKYVYFPIGSFGVYCLQYIWTGTALTTTYNTSTLTNCVAQNCFNSTNVALLNTASGQTRGGVTAWISIPDPTKVASFYLDMSTMTNVSSGDVYISRVVAL